jgi:ribosomal protein S18 acetylase RimI-like enzyme
MSWHRTHDVEQYLAAAGDLLFADPARHTVALTVCENARARADGTVFAWWQEPSGEVTGAVSHTPPYPVVLAAVPEHAIRPLVDELSPTAVNGRASLALQVAAVAALAQGTAAVLRHAERLFRLDGLVPPQVPGSARVAVDADLALLTGWYEAFVAETGVVADDVAESVRDKLSYGGFVLWEADGRPVATSGLSRVAFGSGRIGPVYTPPEHRGHGYGGAVTAAASQRLLERGAWEVVLFTDLTNETTNALYRRLGYVPVGDFAILELDQV